MRIPPRATRSIPVLSYQGSSNATSVKVGDVVVIHSSEQQRAFWKLGRVVEQVRGRDGEIRGATLKIAGKGRRATTLHRPIPTTISS